VRRPELPAPAAYALSVALHAVAFLLVARAPALARPAPDLVQVEVVEAAPPPPPAAPELAPPPRRVAVHATPLRPPREAPRRPAPPEAPPPNAPPPQDAPPPAKAPVRIGISMSSTTSPDGVAAPAGNTLYGELPRSAPDPSQVKPYWSDRYVPPTQVTVLPRSSPSCHDMSPDDYPAEALRLQLEARVRLALTIDEKGEIAEARAVDDPGHGFAAAAVAALKRHGCRFDPARRGGDAVATRIVFTVRFQLP
jgi:protein TonB